MNETTKKPSAQEPNICRDCGVTTPNTALNAQVDENFDTLYLFALCDLCEVKAQATDRGVSLAEYLALVPADLATDLSKGIITRQEHDTWLAEYAVFAVAA